MKNNSLKKIVLIIIIIMIVPSLFYTASEIYSFNENEKLLNDIYTQQLDVILFSINQYAWDYVSTWADKLDNIIIQGPQNAELLHPLNGTLDDNKFPLDVENIRKFLATNNSFRQVIFYDLDFDKKLSVGTVSGQNDKIIQAAERFMDKNKATLGRLKSYKEQDYRKIEPFIIKGDSLSNTLVGLAYVTDFINGPVYAIVVMDANIFIRNAIAKKLTELAGTNLSCAIFDEHTHRALVSNQSLTYNDALVRKKLWIFPNHSLGIGFSGISLSEFSNQRMIKSVVLLVIINLILISGMILVYRNVRREMQLARLKSDFVSNVSHELRTPLSLIRMYAETLEMGRIPAEEKKMEYYKNISHESERLTHLINNILNFSRLESGRKEFHFSPVSVDTLVKSVLETYYDSIRGNGFTLEQNLNAGNVVILADEAAVAENLVNLIDNAIKYSEDERFIRISTTRTQNHVIIEVADHGCGIAEQNLERIFEKFYREEGALTQRTKGSGLGLTLVKYNMQAHGGRVDVFSEKDKGSRFVLNFPLDRRGNGQNINR